MAVAACFLYERNLTIGKSTTGPVFTLTSLLLPLNGGPVIDPAIQEHARLRLLLIHSVIQ